IAGNLGITLEQGAWVITSYAVAEAICVPLTGWLAQRFGTVKVFVLSMLGFGLFSLMCGLSMSLGMLVAARIGQGLCGGPIMPMSQTLLMRVFPPEQRPMAMGLWAMTVILGPAFGPMLGGYISDEFSWHWIFLINVPIAAACIGISWLLLQPLETETRTVPIDKVGLGLLIFWIGCLQIMIDIGRDHDWFGDWKIVALAILAFIGFVIFIIWELTEEHPIVDLRVFRHRGFSASVATMALAFGAFFSGVVVIPQWLQASLGYSATQAGMVMTAQASAALVTAQIVAKLMQRGVDPRLLVFCGVMWMGVASLIRATWITGVDQWSLMWPMFMQGLGIPFMMIPLTAVTLSTVDYDETASAAGLQNFVRTMAVAFATSVVLTIWADSQRVARNELVAGLNPDEAQSRLASMGFSPDQIRQVIANMVDQEAVTLALNHTFIIAALCLFVSGLLVWLSPRVSATMDNAMGH
ncbi:MAG: DHA2 family efflux MFS transporter permease subunit, partial [Novosphingobium sp.]